MRLRSEDRVQALHIRLSEADIGATHKSLDGLLRLPFSKIPMRFGRARQACDPQRHKTAGQATWASNEARTRSAGAPNFASSSDAGAPLLD